MKFFLKYNKRFDTLYVFKRKYAPKKRDGLAEIDVNECCTELQLGSPAPSILYHNVFVLVPIADAAGNIKVSFVDSPITLTFGSNGGGATIPDAVAAFNLDYGTKAVASAVLSGGLYTITVIFDSIFPKEAFTVQYV
jgi:hypothetical protein